MLDLQRLAALPRDVLTGLNRGIEKESLRVRMDGKLATTPHPPLLGSALTHPSHHHGFQRVAARAHHRRAPGARGCSTS
jgi:gamma-glutamylcysteine synthetase